jgi:gliding motility-associated-like protein
LKRVTFYTLKLTILLSFQISCFSGSRAQNLVPNPSFEDIAAGTYDFPFQGFTLVNDWYSAAYINYDSSYLATVDLLTFGKELPPPPFTFWNVRVRAADGINHIGMYDEASKEGFFHNEALATKLIEPLEPGSYYFINFSVRNKGFSHPVQPELCISPDRHGMEVWFDSDSIFFYHDDFTNNSYTLANQSLFLTADHLKEGQPQNWRPLGTCFQATGDENFMAISMPSGKFQVNPPCEIFKDHWDSFYFFYTDLDDIHLEKVPEEILLFDTLCKNRSVTVNLKEEIELPPMLLPPVFTWENGSTDTISTLDKSGLYRISLQLDCTTIPIFLRIEEIACEPEYYIPSAFSPNGDGINDELFTFFNQKVPPLTYNFKVYDRWGNLIFASKDPETRWDGSSKGRHLTEGTFVWKLEFTYNDFELGIQRQSATGSVTILR